MSKAENDEDFNESGPTPDDPSKKSLPGRYTYTASRHNADGMFLPKSYHYTALPTEAILSTYTSMAEDFFCKLHREKMSRDNICITLYQYHSQNELACGDYAQDFMPAINAAKPTNAPPVTRLKVFNTLVRFR